MLNFKSILVPVCLCITLFFTCNIPEEIVTPFVNPPIPELDPDFMVFTLDVSKDTTVVLNSGTQIHIPAFAFQNENGLQTKGKVSLHFREFHDAAHIFLAGISMDYHQNGKPVPFQTAGSFDIRATQKNKQLTLSQEKSIDVKLASFEKANDYNFYYLNEAGRKWDSLGIDQPETNLEKQKLQNKIKKMVPSVRFPLNRKYFGFNYNALLDIYMNNKIQNVNHSYLKDRFEQYGLGWENIDSRQVISFEGKKEPVGMMVWKNISGKPFPEWTKNHFANVELIKGKKYRLTILSKDSTQQFTTKILAVMPLQALFMFPPEKWKNDYQATMAKITAERERVKLMADVYRNFSISNLGIYNWDRIMKMEEKVELTAEFIFDTPINDQLHQIEVIYIPGDNKSVIKYPKYRWKEFPLVPDEKGKMFALLPGKKVAVFPPSEYKKIDFKSLKESVNPFYQFKMKTTTLTINSAEDFRKVVGI